MIEIHIKFGVLVFMNFVRRKSGGIVNTLLQRYDSRLIYFKGKKFN